MTELKLSITKDEINQLPRYEYQGTIVLIDSQEQAQDAVTKLQSEKILGFDTETKASFKKGEAYDISLLQLATSTHAYLFRLNKFKLFPELVSILSNPNIIKAGVAIRDDVNGLNKLYPFEAQQFLDLAHIAKKRNIQNFGLRALTAICLHKKLSKKEKISNWEKEELTPGQIQYAACDAAVGLEIYNILAI